MAKVKPNFKTTRQTFIRAWRKHRKLTLERLAERLDVTAGALSQLERGETSYTQPMLEALADALACEPADLITRNPESEAGLYLIWSQLNKADQKRALDLLKSFARTGTDG